MSEGHTVPIASHRIETLVLLLHSWEIILEVTYTRMECCYRKAVPSSEKPWLCTGKSNPCSLG